jgi:hypothetical protein
VPPFSATLESPPSGNEPLEEPESGRRHAMIETSATESKVFRRPLAARDSAVNFCSLVGRRLRAIGRRLMTRSPKRIEQPLPSPDTSYSRLSRDVMRIEARRLL